MVRFGLALIALVLPLGTLAAQTHVVTTQNFSFVDSVSGNSDTVITLGETIEWVWNNGAHLISDGNGPEDPQFGARFTLPSDMMNPSVTFTPTSTGTFAYFCHPHTCCGMFGTITVLPPPLPGSGEDFVLSVTVNGSDVLLAQPGDQVSIAFSSPLGTFDLSVPVLVGQIYANFGTGPASPGGFPYVHVNTFGGFIAFNDSGPFGPVLLPPGGYVLLTSPPPFFSGFTVRLQALALSGLANDGIFAVSDALDVVVE